MMGTASEWAPGVRNGTRPLRPQRREQTPRAATRIHTHASPFKVLASTGVSPRPGLLQQGSCWPCVLASFCCSDQQASLPSSCPSLLTLASDAGRRTESQLQSSSEAWETRGIYGRNLPAGLLRGRGKGGGQM